MLLQATPPFMAKGETGGGGGGGAGTKLAAVQALFTGSEDGFIYCPADPSTLALNSDGTGGSPSSEQGFRFAQDLSGNGNHARGLATYLPAGNAGNFHSTPAMRVGSGDDLTFDDPTFAVGQPFAVGTDWVRQTGGSSIYTINGTSNTINNRVVLGFSNETTAMIQYFGNALTGAVTFLAGQPRTVIARQTTTGRTLYVDGGSVATDSFTTYPYSFPNGGLGVNTAAGTSLTAAVGISGVRSDADIAVINTYLADPLG